MRYDFGRCHLDTVSRAMTLDGASMRLSPKAFELLRLLIEDRPRVIPKAELMQRLWPDAFVDEATLPVLVPEVRAVGDALRDCEVFGGQCEHDRGRSGNLRRTVDVHRDWPRRSAYRRPSGHHAHFPARDTLQQRNLHERRQYAGRQHRWFGAHAVDDDRHRWVASHRAVRRRSPRLTGHALRRRELILG
jgi:hypothetical protein